MKLKTNINCHNCVAKVQNTLDTLIGSGNWQVDTQNPDKILEVKNVVVTPNQINDKLKRIGFFAEEIGLQ